MTYTGKVSEIIYTNDENGYTVVVFDTDSDTFIAVGIFPPISDGEMLKLTGEFKENKRYGEQFAVESVDFVRPEDEYGIIRYLSSGLFKGIREKLAREIVEKFGARTLEILDTEPERLIEVNGIGRKKLMEIIECYEETRKMKESILFLQKHDITMNLALKIYRKYGESTIDIMKANPYVLVTDIEGVGFLTADRIAQKMGIAKDSGFRIAAGISHTLSDYSVRAGHTCLPEEMLLTDATKLLDVPKSLVENVNFGMDLKREEVDGQTLVASSLNYHTENAIAAKLVKLNLTVERNDIDVVKELEVFERQTNIILDVNQRAAIKSVFQNGVSVITGGPGTGKTTIIKAIVNMVKNRGKKCLLCAPTGRASKRMMEATGEEAKTIHRLLGMDGSGREASCYGEGSPLPVDVLIVDEISMADIYIFNTLLKAIPLGARLVLVGDKDQLPSVACGNILSDVIGSNVINVVYLTEVYRQSSFSTIVSNAHRINRGEMPVTKNAKDFFLSTKTEIKDIQNDVLSMIKTRIPSFIHVTSADIQVLSPIKKSEVGVEVLNGLLQEELNPNGAEFRYKDTVFREGDRVMQTVNNYQLEWWKPNSYEPRGTGVFNGDIGVIKEVFKDAVIVEFDDGRRVKYEGSAPDELTLAYCISVHKSQGSEFPVVILVLGKTSPMLLTRNLVYTAVTRAKKMVVILGEEQALRYAISNTYTAKRYSLLRPLIIKNKGKAELLWGNGT